MTAALAAADYSAPALASAAGVDPWALHDRLAAGSPDAILRAAGGFRRAGEHAVDATDLGRIADRAVAAAFVNDGRPVFDAVASSARSHILLGAGGERMEEAARALVDVAAALTESTDRAAARVAALEDDVNRIIGLRNAFFAANAAVLTPATAAAAEQRFHRMAVDATRGAGRAVQADVDEYDAVLGNRTGRLLAMGYRAAEGDPTGDEPNPVDEAIAPVVGAVGDAVVAADEFGDGIVDGIAGGVVAAGTAVGGPVGAALQGLGETYRGLNKTADGVAGDAGTTVGDAIGGETGGAISDAADGIAGRKDPPGTYSGELVPVNKPDAHADRLAEHLGGRSRVRFTDDPNRHEFDVVSDEYIGQAKPSDTQIGQRVRVQAKVTFEAAQDSGKAVYYHFEGGPPDRDVVRALERYSERYGVPVVIDSEPL